MKRLLICPLVLLFISCAGNNNMSHTETAQIVAESFFSKDESALKKHTTSDGYASLITVQNMIPDSDKTIEVEILDEAIDGEIAKFDALTLFFCSQSIFPDSERNIGIRAGDAFD